MSYIFYFLFLFFFSQQNSKTGAERQREGLQLPPQKMPNDQDGDQCSGLSSQPSQFHRTQSVTSAVDYNYFDVGIGQVPDTGILK